MRAGPGRRRPVRAFSVRCLTVPVTSCKPGDPDGVRVAVRDSGPGIAAEDLPRVFDRFWRGEKSRAREKGGSGLGLAIARQWVEAMGGRIGAASRPGEGSEFWFSLPIAR